MELLMEVPNLLKTGHIVHFGEGWPEAKAKKYFRVERANQLMYDVHRIVAPGNATSGASGTAVSIQDISFEAPSTGSVSDAYLSLLPVKDITMYELLLGFKGLGLVYPRYANRYQQQLETSLVLPTPTSDALAWMGFFDSQQSPWYAPKVRMYTVKDQEPPHMYLYNPYQDDEKVVVRFVVNKCKLVSVVQPTEQDKKVARELTYYTQDLW